MMLLFVIFWRGPLCSLTELLIFLSSGELDGFLYLKIIEKLIYYYFSRGF